jgi:hypothetical protein
MDASIFLTFSTPQGQDSHEFEWKICDTPIARRWFIEMDYSLRLKDNLREQRFTGWNHSAADQKDRVEGLNKAISVINSFYQERHHITERASLNMPQEVLNALHHHFELLMGQSWNRSTLTQDVPGHVLVQVRLLNDLVHDYEAADRAQAVEDAGEKAFLSLHCQLVPYRQQPLTKEDLSLFTYAHDWGDLFSNYCQLGKNWSEVFHDKDEHIHPENIAPLRFYASSFGAYFYTHDKEASENLKKQVKDFIRSRAEATKENVDPDDVKHALGHVVFAKLSSQSVLFQMPETERDAFMKKHANITAIRVQSELGDFKRDFPNPDDYFGTH